MKKRSLVASIAMLLVSAIVLSTSTYAWFSAGATVSAAEITASVNETDGTIKISVDQSNWKDALTESDIRGASGALFPTAMKPISVNASVSGITNATAKPATLTSSGSTMTITPGTLAGTEYTKYTFYLQGDAGIQATISPTFEADLDFLFGMVVVNGTSYKVYGNAGKSYYPLLATAACTDSDSDGIVDSGEGSVGTQVTVDNVDFDPVTFVSGQNIQVDVYMWAEGQEASCTGNNTRSGDCSFEFTINSTI